MILALFLIAGACLVLCIVASEIYSDDFAMWTAIGCVAAGIAMVVCAVFDMQLPLPRETIAAVNLGPTVRLEAQRLKPGPDRALFEWPFVGTSVEYRLMAGGSNRLVLEDDARDMLRTQPAPATELWREMKAVKR